MTDDGVLNGRQPQAIRNAFAVLSTVARLGPGCTAANVVAALGLSTPTTYRMLNFLVAEEYLVRLPDLSGFALGTRAAELTAPVPPPARSVDQHRSVDQGRRVDDDRLATAPT